MKDLTPSWLWHKVHISISVSCVLMKISKCQHLENHKYCLPSRDMKYLHEVPIIKNVAKSCWRNCHCVKVSTKPDTAHWRITYYAEKLFYKCGLVQTVWGYIDGTLQRTYHPYYCQSMYEVNTNNAMESISSPLIPLMDWLHAYTVQWMRTGMTQTFYQRLVSWKIIKIPC